MSLSILGFFLFIIPFSLGLLLLLLSRKKSDETTDELLVLTKKQRNKQRWSKFYQVSYLRFTQLPLLSGYLLKIRKRLESMQTYDEYTLRRETIKITYKTLGIVSLIILISVITRQDWFTVFYVLFAVYVINALLITYLVNRLEDRLLDRMSIFIEDVRHYYQQLRMIDEAIYEAAQKAPYEVSLHALKIYEVLTSFNSKEKIELYYSVAPNKYFKEFAYISHIIMECGDNDDKSLYLDALNRIREEINFELLRRKKTSNLFKGLSTVALAPIFFVTFVENWAIKNFPVMEAFYSSRLGLYLKVAVHAIIVLAYFIIRKMQENDEENYKVQPLKKQWEKRIYKLKFVKWFIDRLVPPYYTRNHFRLSMLLKDSNTPIPIEFLYIQRVLISLIVFSLSVAFFLYGHHLTINYVLYKPTTHSFLGQMTEQEREKAQLISDFDREMIEKLIAHKKSTIEDIIELLQVETSGARDSTTILTAQRIYKKLVMIEMAYFKWWELLITMLLAGVAYWLPVIGLVIKKQLRSIEMKNEVDQFRTLISILIRIDRMSVQIILEWLERSSIVFKLPLKKCLLDYDSGAEKVLNELKNDVSFLPFVRIIEKLQLAVEKISLRDVFDDLEIDREYFREERKEHFNKVLKEKAEWGMLISLTPMMSLVLLYLVFPMIYMSIDSMKIINQLN